MTDDDGRLKLTISQLAGLGLVSILGYLMASVYEIYYFQGFGVSSQWISISTNFFTNVFSELKYIVGIASAFVYLFVIFLPGLRKMHFVFTIGFSFVFLSTVSLWLASYEVASISFPNLIRMLIAGLISFGIFSYLIVKINNVIKTDDFAEGCFIPSLKILGILLMWSFVVFGALGRHNARSAIWFQTLKNEPDLALLRAQSDRLLFIRFDQSTQTTSGTLVVKTIEQELLLEPIGPLAFKPVLKLDRAQKN